MALFLPSTEVLLELSERSGLDPNDPAVLELFDQLVLRGHLKPFVPGWWELIKWNSRKVEKLLKAARSTT